MRSLILERVLPMGCQRTVATRLLAVLLSLGGRTHAEKKDKRDMSGQLSVFLAWLDSLKWTGKKKNSEYFLFMGQTSGSFN